MEINWKNKRRSTLQREQNMYKGLEITRWMLDSCHRAQRREGTCTGEAREGGRDLTSLWSEVKWSESHSVVSGSLQPHELYSSWNSPGQDTEVGKLFPPPGDLPNPGVKSRSPALQADSLSAEPHWKPKNTGVGSLSHLQGIFPTQESNRISCIAGGFFTNWAIRAPPPPSKKWKLVTLSCLTLFDPMICSHQAPLSMEFPRQEYWSG